MLQRIVSIAGKPGLYRLVNRGKNMLIVESLADGRRVPAYARDKVVSLADVSIYTLGEGDTPLGEVFEKVKAATDGKPVDVKKMGDTELREYFKTILPDFDDERVYTTDIRKLFSWYNQLVAAGVTDFTEEPEENAEEAESAPAEKE